MMKYIKRTDLIVIAALILLSTAAILFMGGINSKDDNAAFVYHNNKLIKEISLSEAAQTFSFTEAEGVIIKTDGEGNIFFYESDCPDKICVRTGNLKRAGQSAACLPNGIVVNIKSMRGSSEQDVIVQ